MLRMDNLLTPMEMDALLLSLRVATVSIAVALPIALAFAWLFARCHFPGKSLLIGIIHLPLILPPVVIGYVLLILLGRKGMIGAFLYDWFDITLAFTWKGAAIAAAIVAFPLMVRSMRLSLEAVDRGLEGAARTLGASSRRTFLTITVPLMMPGILTALILGFARALGEFGATITFVSNIPRQTQTLPLALYTLTQTPGEEAGATRLAVISVAVALVAMVAAELLAKRLQSEGKGAG